MNKKTTNKKTIAIFNYLLLETEGKKGKAIRLKNVCKKFSHYSESMVKHNVYNLFRNGAIEREVLNSNMSKYYTCISLDEFEKKEFIEMRERSKKEIYGYLDNFIFSGSSERIVKNINY